MADSQVPDLNFMQQSTDLISITDELGKRAIKMAAEREAAEKTAATKIPKIVELMRTTDCIPEDLQTKAAGMLQDHGNTLDILHNVLTKMASQGQHLGEPYGENGKKRAVMGDVDSPYCGARTTEKKASFRNFEVGILGRELKS